MAVHTKILRTKQSLRNALWQLIGLMDINDITVSQICSEAGINRTTFYKYYSLPFDILKEFVDEMCEQVLTHIRKKNDTNTEIDIYAIMLDLCRFYYSNKQVMKIYLDYNRTLLPIIQNILAEDLGISL